MTVTAAVIDETIAALRALASSSVTVGARAIRADDEATLHPVEAAIVASAAAKRRREFASGRTLLRLLLGTNEPVTALTSRAPSLPAGVVASLAHDDEVVIAAVSRDPSVRAIGIDLEPIGAVGADVADTVRRPEERHLDPTWVFVVKEATYKAWSTGGGRFLSHADVTVRCTGSDPADPADASAGSFVAEVIGEHRSFIGGSARVGGRIVAIVVDTGQDGPR